MIPAEAKGRWRDVQRRLRPYVARRVARAEADDVVQEVLLRAFRGLPALADDRRFGPWVYQIAARVIADWQVRRSRQADMPPVPAADACSAEAVSLDGQLTACVGAFVARLPRPYRDAIRVTALQGLSQNRAARVLGISPSGMKSRVQRARRRLRAMFEACCALSLDRRRHVYACDPRSAGGCVASRPT